VKAQLILVIDERGIAVTRCDGLIPDFTITAEQQVDNPALGAICRTSNFDQAIRAIRETAESVIVGTLNGNPVDATGAMHVAAVPENITVKVERINVLEPSKKFVRIDHINGDGSRDVLLLTPDEGKYLSSQLSTIFLER
jgi:hypothetical protein